MRIIFYTVVIFTLITSILTSINAQFFQSQIIGIVFGLIYLFLHAYILGFSFCRRLNISNLYTGFLFLLSLIIFLSTICYYFFNLSQSVITAIILLISFICLLIFIVSFYYIKNKNKLFEDIKKNFIFDFKANYSYSSLILLILSLLFVIVTLNSFSILFDYEIINSVRTPWKTIPIEFKYSYCISTFILISILLYNKSYKISLFFLFLHYFLTISIALIVYKIGYGYDPFIHRATEELIFKYGQVLPKTFYYIGQYSLIILLSRLLNISYIILDFFLVPVLFSIFVPLSIYSGFKNIFKNKKYTLLISTFGLIYPLYLFITTTPQSLANTLLICAIFLGLYILNQKKKFLLIPFGLLILSILLIHPIAGIPGVIYYIFVFFFIFLKKQNGWIEVSRHFLLVLLVLVCSFFLPLLFIINAYLSNTLHTLFTSFNLPSFNLLYLQNRFNLIKDIVYFYTNNYFYLIIFFTLTSLASLFTAKKVKYILPCLFAFISTFFNYIIISGAISFEALIEYERGDYASRVFHLSFYFLLPIFCYGFYRLLVIVHKKYSLSVNLFVLLFLTVIITSSMYTAYPREDGYTYSRGYNVSNSDIAAVHFINMDAFQNDTQDYIVLSNQMVSSAALQEFGFSKYYEIDEYGKLFYYPIPTSSPLYRYYLDMVYTTPSIDIIKDAGNFAEVNNVYFVINKYWAKSREIISQTKKIADSWTALDEGNIYVFKFILDR